MKAAVVEAVVDRVEEGDKEKKKRRPRNRRPKQNPSTSVSGSSVNELHGEASPECLGNGTMENHVTTSLKQHHLGMNPPYEQGLTKASNLAFSSLPTMHIVESLDVQSPENQRLLPSDFGGKMFAKSCPEPAACGGSPGILTNKGSPPQHFEGYSQRKYFPPHWSMEDVNDALEKGDAFKALFRVNAHNRIEAYCKIDGVPTDVLIGGLAEQNRAVEGDIVVIKMDPLPLWTRMKGSAGACKSSAPVEDLNLNLEDTAVGCNCKGKVKVDEDCEYDSRTSYLLPERGSCSEESTYLRDSTHSEPIGQSCCDHAAGKYQLASDSSQAGSSSEQNVVKTPVERMCAIISSFPSKRPTGRVVAIIERSKRRDAVIGFLNVKKWISYREFCRKDMKKNKSLSYSDHEYIQMTPTDPRFPKMVVLVRNLPDAIKKRLENGDETIEKELFSARVDEWGEESLAPQALILRAFGHGTEVQPHIEAILFENAINSSEFSPESLSCLPRLPWEVPREEFQTRKDLRNLCIFTIDPSTATDLDDALSVENFSNGISRVGIHITDASYFVLPDTPLDEEAQSRSTSVYMTHRKIPMLPSLLSENIGSLNPGAERLSFSIFLDLNNAGDVVDRWIGRTVIRSCCKLSYEHAQDIIDGKFNSESFDTFKDSCPQIHGQFEWSDVIRSVKNLSEVSKTLKERRFSDGALQLDNSKVVILFDECGDPYDSLFSERNESTSLVEEFMLLANRTAAEVISRAFPNSALLRRHPEPNMRKLKEFEAFCSKHGLELDTSSSGRFHQSLERIREKLKDDSVLFNILMNYATKPMQLATYFCSGELKHKENDWGHYGLAVPLYTHFTSPLRRYPDIVVHRTLAAAIEAEELYLEHQRLLNNLNRGDKFKMRCFSSPLSLLGNDNYFKSTLLITDVMGVSMRSNEAPLLILLIVIMHSQTMECEISSNLLQSPNREALRVFSNMQNLYHQQSNSNSHVSVHLCAPLHAWQVTTDDGTAFGAALINIKHLNMKHSTLWYVPLLTCDIPHAVLWLGYLQVDYNLGCDLMTMDNESELVLYTGYQTPQICWSIAYESRKSNNNISGKICSVSLVSNSLNLYDRTKSLLWQFAISRNKDQNAFWAAVLGQDGSITFLKFQKRSSVVVEATKISQESCSLPEHCESYLVCYFDGWCQYQLSSLLSSCFNCKSPALRTCNSSKSSVDSLYVYQKLDYFALGFAEPSMKSNLSSCKEAHPGELPDGIQLAVIKIEGKFQGQIVLRAEFTIIKKIQNVQLVKLRGFCAKGLHKLLVYEYTAKRSLDEWIFKKKKDDHFLDWNTRFSIALGTAKGLAYLHEECNEKIVYCDIKPENVLPENGMQIVHWRSIGRQSCFYLQGDFVSFYIGASISIISEGYLEFGIHLHYANSYSTIMQCNPCSSFKISEFFRQAILYKNLLFLAAATHALFTHGKLMLTGYYSNSTFGHHTDTGVTIPCILQFSLPSHEDMASFKGAGLLGSQLVRWVMYWACMVYIYLGLIIVWGIGSGYHAYGSLGIVNCSVI